MKRVAMLLDGQIHQDYRVTKMIQTLSTVYFVDLYYVNGNIENDKLLFSDNVNLISLKYEDSKFTKLLRHTLFCYEFNFFISAVVKSKNKYDLIWANDLTTLYQAHVISKKLNAELIYDSHEIYIETLNQFLPSNAKGFKKVVVTFLLKVMRLHGKKIEKKIFNTVDKFITVNSSLLIYFNETYNLKQKGIYIFNYPSLSTETQNNINERSKLPYPVSEEDIIIVYQGVFNEGRGLRQLVKSMTLLPNRFKLFLIGRGSLYPTLSELILKHHLQNRVFIDFANTSENYYTKTCNIGINLTEDINLSKRFASPNKVFQYVHARIPVVLSTGYENSLILQQFKIGCEVNIESESIATAIVDMVQNGLEKYDSELEKAKEEYCWQTQEKKLLNYIQSI